ncbi:hypothetical protein G6F56_000478 [Rhizopus delemar]|uniref:Mitochondrial thiamine pyrophosphate transporter n=1 Tax=Rhizopus stolonifer TaxID=4846 RepID=A0A367KXG3_RHIST|nr:hypothetical protein G6F56_000478 [Rhizopus delemar]RCI06790.1 mitochondrial thiamine pyrophosphate transporter [Rhizopus stolonifer]
MSSHVTSSKLNASETALCGGIAGVATRFVISPLDVVKIRLQVQSIPFLSRSSKQPVKYKGISQTFKTIIKEEGIRGFFKGNVAAEYLYLTYGISQFYAYYYIDAFMENKMQLAPSLKPFISGMIAGSFATTVTYPFDLLRTRFAVQGTKKIYKSLSHAVLDIYNEEGPRGFYRGLGSSITQIMPYMGLMFFSYEGLCSFVQKLKEKQIIEDKHSRTNDMVCGSLAGIISKTGVFPLDVIRKRLQVQGPHISEYAITSIPNYMHQNSMFGCMKKMIYTEGFCSLYKGLAPGLLKAGPSGAAYFLVFEFSKDCIIRLKEDGHWLSPDISLLNA